MNRKLFDEFSIFHSNCKQITLLFGEFYEENQAI